MAQADIYLWRRWVVMMILIGDGIDTETVKNMITVPNPPFF